MQNLSNTLHFHSFAAKKVFIRQQKIQPSEILLQTDGSITFIDSVRATDFKNNVHVFSVTE